MKYKLLKDLPFAKAGEMVEVTSVGYAVVDEGGLRVTEVESKKVELGKYECSLPKDANVSEWLEEVDERWKPGMFKTYFYFDSVGDVHVTDWANCSVDEARYKSGNCFRTREKAQRAAEEVKKTLQEFHKNNP